MKKIDKDFENILSIAKGFYSDSVEWTSSIPKDQSFVTVLLSSKNNIYTFVFDRRTYDEADLLKELINQDDTIVKKIVCMFSEDVIDIPWYLLRKALCDLNKENEEAEVLLQFTSGLHGRKLSETF